MILNKVQLTVLNINDYQYEVGDGTGGSFTMPKSILQYLINEGGKSETQYLIYQIAIKLQEQDVDLNNSEAVAQAIGDMEVIK
jgi:hypothetical protein